MPQAFHVDRSGQLTPGTRLDRRQVAPINLTNVAQLVRLDAQFPAGLSHFGVLQFFDRAFINSDGNVDQEIELIFELVRRLEYRDQPCRLAAIYAVETLDEAVALRDEWLPSFPDAQIVELDAGHTGRYDSELLDLAGSAWDVLERARAYWRGDGTADARWELLLEPPADVIRVVTA